MLGAGCPNHPQEAVAGLVQAGGDLLQLLVGLFTCVGDAPEAEEHDAAVGLSVEPHEALMSAALITGGGGGFVDQWPHGVPAGLPRRRGSSAGRRELAAPAPPATRTC